MKIIFKLAFTLLIPYSSFAQFVTSKNTVYSKFVKDNFEIYISTPKNYSAETVYHVVYYCDANLKSGKALREIIEAPSNNMKNDKTIFVGIGHIGNYHVLRRRDFILPFIKQNDTIARSSNYGNCEQFYNFLTKELMPSIQSQYKTSNVNSIFGHSLGGLFTFYCLFKNDSIFKNYYALSPALWINKYDIYKFNKLNTSSSVSKKLYFSCGELETMNHIKKGTDDMNEFFTKNNFPNLNFAYQIHSNKNHNSQVENSIQYLLDNL